MKNTLKLVTIMVALSAHLRLRGGLALAVRAAQRPHLGAEGPPADMAAGRSEGALDGTGGRRLRRTRRQRRERVSAGPGREGRRHAARARSGERQGAVDVRLRRARQLHVRRLTHDADRRRRARLHRRTDGGSARHQHEDTQARLAQEHLEGLRRRRRTAAVGDRAESVDLRRSADRGAADAGGRRRRLRQADRRAQMEVCRAVRHSRVRDAVDRQGRRRGSARHDHRAPSVAAATPGTAASTVSIRAAARCCGPTPTGSASSRSRRPSTPARAACSSPARMAPARR